MTLKTTWVNGEIYPASEQNALAAIVNTLNSGTLELAHDFTDDANGTPVTADTGQAWTLTYGIGRPASVPVIASGKYVIADSASGVGAGYLTAQLAARTTFLSGDFQFGASGATDTGAAALICWSANLPSGTMAGALPDAAAHVVFAHNYYTYSAISGNTLVPLGTVYYASNIDNQHVEVGIDKDNNTAYVLGADGTITAFTDALIGSISAPYACAEIFYNAADTDKRVTFTKFAASANPIDAQSSSLNRAALLRRLKSAGIDKTSTPLRLYGTNGGGFQFAWALDGTVATPFSVPYRDANGNLQTATPSGSTDAVNKAYADARASSAWEAPDQGWLAWNFDPAAAFQGFSLTAGFVYVQALKLRAPATITNLILNVFSAGTTLTSGQNFAALYQGTTLKAATADQTTAWGSTGLKTMALTTPQAVTAGLIYVAAFVNFSGASPAFSSCIAQAGGSLTPLLGGSQTRFGVDGTNTGRTTTFPSTLAAPTGVATGIWAAVS